MRMLLPRFPLHVSVSSVLPTQETRLGAGGGGCRRAMLVVPAGKGAAACARSRRGRRVPAPTARAMGAGLARHVARKRFERPSDARNAAWGGRWRISPGHACCPSRQGSRRARPLPPRQARPRAYRSRHGGVAAPVLRRASVSSVQRMRETRLGAGGGAYRRALLSPPRQKPRRVRPLPPRQARPRAYRSRHGGGAGPACCAQAFRASFRRKKRGLGQEVADAAGPCARTSRQRFGGPQPSKVYSYRPASPGGRGVCALGRKHSLRRPPPGEVNGAAVGEVGGRRTPRRKRSAQAELFRRALTAFLPAPR